MPATSFSCPACATPLRTSKPLAAGSLVKCPRCGQGVRVPGAITPAAGARPVPRSAGNEPLPAGKSPLVWVVVGAGALFVTAAGITAAILTSGYFHGPKAEQAGGESGNKSDPVPVRKDDAPPKELLVGRWQSGEGKDKVVMEYRDNGTLRLVTPDAPVIEGNYRFLAADQLSVTLSVPGGPPVTQKLKLKVGRDELTTTDEQGRTDRFKRVTGAGDDTPVTDPAQKPSTAPKDLLVGRWESGEGKDKVLMEFRDDGKLRMTVPGAPEIAGAWQLPEEGLLQITLSFPGGEQVAQKLKVKVSAEELVTTDEKGREDRYKRAGAGPAKPPPPPAPGSPADLPGLLAYWKLDEGKGMTATDSSKNGMRATLHGGGWAPGVKGTALQFDKDGDYLDYGDAAALNFKAGAPFTFAGWVKTTAEQGAVMSQRNSKDGGANIDLTLNGGRLTALVREDRRELGRHATVTGGAVNDGDWHHFALTRSGGTIELFLDGVSQGKATGADAGGAITTDLRALGAELYWVKSGMGSPYLRGTVDEFCVFDRALGEAEVRKLAGPPRR